MTILYTVIRARSARFFFFFLSVPYIVKNALKVAYLRSPKKIAPTHFLEKLQGRHHICHEVRVGALFDFELPPSIKLMGEGT